MEAVFEATGSFGRFQFVSCIVPVLMFLLSPGYLLAPVYLMFDPPHRCRLPAESLWSSNDTYKGQSQLHSEAIAEFIPLLGNSSKLDSCNILQNGTSVECGSWVHEKIDFDETLTTELGLFCGNKSISTLVSTCTFAGVTVGVLSGGYLADIIGRRRSLLCSLWLLTAAEVASMFAVSPAYTAICRFFIGAGGLSSSTIGFVSIFELIGPDVRHHLLGAQSYSWVTGSLLCALIAFLTGSWRWFQLIILIGTAVTLLLAHWRRLAPETARWLLAQGRTEEAVQLVERMLKENRIEDGLQRETLSKFRKDLENVDGEKEEVVTLGKSLILMLKAPFLLLQYGIICFNWFTLSAVYYGLAMGAKNLPGNIFVTSSLLAAVEIPAYIILHMTSHCIGRRITFIIFTGTAGVFLMASAASSYFAKEHEWLLVTTSILGRGLNCGAFTLIYVWTNELYATNMRLAGLSTSSMCARLGSLFAPLLANVRDFIPGDLGASVSFLIFAVASSLSAVASCFVRETLNKPTPDSVTELILANNNKSKAAKTSSGENEAASGVKLTEEPLLHDARDDVM